MGGGIALATTSSPSGGTVHVLDYGDGLGVASTVLLTGAIGDNGSANSIDADGTPDPENNTQVALDLVRGTFRLDVSAVNTAINNAFNNFQPNNSTCSGIVNVTATAPIVSGSGTGSYKGISGSFKLTLSLGEIGPKNTSGKNKGQCDQSNNAPPIGQAMIVTGSGNVSF